ncbi:hypothetical protein MYCTH_2051636 [Thermothelomyces thermophilus ATCC 42464]|uniref:Prolyl 4-hydroxylase alpha subunit domain-containing protein n=1 Tax=Thermothelomyces thermophilus (strain ATCC 42464 / BCRC 31852 / DSM 1799) TaxID=573729 RepID=G2Q4W9_THET4|nr:uncharacterized protein MYCTH_2051636 [Thermothelomyces thermophilus ATCC 42464]AEO53706.1 hypothetical protein MYCTH_2051636 [Thermothelomyces thermophilus ATCC 42464]
MSVTSLAKTAGIWAGGLLLGLSLPHLPHLGAPRLLTSLVGDFSILPGRGLGLPFLTKPIRTTTTTTNNNNNNTASTFVCDTTHTYRTELVSLDPLIMYIHDLITPAEIAWLLETGEPRFAPSQVSKYGRQQQTADRTSSSAGLPRDDPAVMCVLNRTRAFLGTMLRDGWDEMGPPQLVRYTAGQRFNLHHDWFDVPQRAAAAAASDDGEFVPRRWNRVASFFAILEDDCTGGETYLPYAKPIVPPSRRGEAMWQGGEREQEQEQEEARPLWREHEDGGLAFRPVAGNAVFWVNLHANGTGDPRTNHAGLPLESGRKTAMNIWPRQYYP